MRDELREEKPALAQMRVQIGDSCLDAA